MSLYDTKTMPYILHKVCIGLFGTKTLPYRLPIMGLTRCPLGSIFYFPILFVIIRDSVFNIQPLTIHDNLFGKKTHPTIFSHRIVGISCQVGAIYIVTCATYCLEIHDCSLELSEYKLI